MAIGLEQHIIDTVPHLRFVTTPWRVRARAGPRTVVDSRAAVLVWEPRRLVPVFGVPAEDIDAELVDAGPADVDLEPLPPMMGPEHFEVHTVPGRRQHVSLGGGVTLDDAAFIPDSPVLDGAVLLDFAAFDGWLQEDQELVGHPHDPFHRIDTVRSSRHVVIALDGDVLADTTRAVGLHETHLPVRWYVPREDTVGERLEPSSTRSTCAYKGHASYLSLSGAGADGEDICWTYQEPLNDAVPVGGMLCFWAERTDLTVDDQPVPRPTTPWSVEDDS